MGVRVTFNFSLYAMSLLVALVAYFGRSTQDIAGRQLYKKVRGMLLLIPEVDDSFS